MLKNLENSQVLLTGATGFIGGHLLESLKQIPGLTLICVSRKPQPDRWPSSGLWVQSPLQDLTGGLWRKKGLRNIDYVFHLGGFTPKSASKADQVEENFDDNLLATRALLESLPSQPRRFLFASTLDVYAPSQPGQVLDESSSTIPANLYGASKLFCETLVQSYGRKNSLPFTILRYGHIYGPGEEAYEKLIPRSIRQLKNGSPLKVFGKGQALRDYLYVGDAVRATLALAVLEKAQGETYNIVRGASLPIQQVLETLVRAGKFKGVIEHDTKKPEGISFQFNNRKLVEALGEWKPLDLEEGLRRELESFK